MNLDKLFQMQKELDERINKEHGLEGQDLLPKKILALQVELGELANEWRGFKFWSKDQEPRIKTICEDCGGDGVTGLYDDVDCFCENVTNPLLEEYVDCLHFILSIGNDIGCKSYEYIKRICLTDDITNKFNAIFKLIGQWEIIFLYLDDNEYKLVLSEFIELGKKLGFTWEQIEQAYLEKNAVNHTRQSEGY